jgi:hypothetical protein
MRPRELPHHRIGTEEISEPSEVCPSLLRVKGTFGTDPYENLLAYARAHFSPDEVRFVAASLGEVRQALDAGNKADFGVTRILRATPEKHLEAMTALADDIRVHLIARRNAMLRRCREKRIDLPTLKDIFRSCCSREVSGVDPDLPKVAAQVIVQHCPQVRLIGWIYEEVDQLAHAINEGIDPDRHLQQLGRILLFLRWVPQDWVEELLLETLDRVPLSQEVMALRLYISVLRVLFARPRLHAATIAGLLDRIFERFASSVPMELRRLLRAVFIKGGMGTRDLLATRMSEDQDRYMTEFFLEPLTVIDKAWAYRFLLHSREELIPRLGELEFLRLTAKTGEVTVEIHDRIFAAWEKARSDNAAKLVVLEIIEELRCRKVLPYIASTVSRESSWPIQLEIVDLIGAIGTFEDLTHLVEAMKQDESLLRYYTVDLMHRKLLDAPQAMRRLEDSLPLHDIQVARRQVYELYLCLYRYRTFLASLRDLHRMASRLGAGEILIVGSGYSLEADLDRTQLTAEEEQQWEEAWQEALAARAEYRARSAHYAPLEKLLEHAREFRPRRADNISGHVTLEFGGRKPIDREDLLLPAGLPRASLEREFDSLFERATDAIEFMQETLLFKEWFVRECPFVLTEGVRDLIESIRRGEDVPIDEQSLEDPVRWPEIQRQLAIFCSSARQGIYLTDLLLDFLSEASEKNWDEVIHDELVYRHSLVARGSLVYLPDSPFAKHLRFTAFAHDYRYGRESLVQASLGYLWQRYLDASTELERAYSGKNWNPVPKHPELPPMIGPLTEKMYAQHLEECEAFRDLTLETFYRFRESGVRVRVIPNLNYGLYCVAPVMPEIRRSGIHVSLAGISSLFCDDVNTHQFYLPDDALFPLKHYLFSRSANFNAMNHDCVLIVVDGTMEPMDRHDATKVRLPKAYRGYINYLAAVNYIRAKYGYEMEYPEREVASSLNLPPRFVRNLVRTPDFKRLVEELLPGFDARELTRSHRKSKTGKTYYTFAQWNPDRLPAWIGTTGYRQTAIPCSTPEDLSNPTLLFVSMSSLYNRTGVPAFFDNNAEVEKPRIVMGPEGVKVDIGWPGEDLGIVVDFSEPTAAPTPPR